MILSFYIDVQNSVSIRSMVGTVGKEEFIGCLKVIWKHPDYSMKQNHLIDLRRCKVIMTPRELSEVSEFMTTNDNIHDRRVGFLVDGSNPAGYSTMYGEKTKHKHLSEVFASENDVIAYTKAPSDIFDKLNSELATIIEI